MVEPQTVDLLWILTGVQHTGISRGDPRPWIQWDVSGVNRLWIPYDYYTWVEADEWEALDAREGGAWPDRVALGQEFRSRSLAVVRRG